MQTLSMPILRPGQHQRQHYGWGFTLVEVLVALVVMSLLALLSWRAVDGMQRVEVQTRTRSDALLTLQASLSQWGADLDALVETSHVAALSFDGRSLRLTRRDPLEAQRPGVGVQVVAWASHNGQWMRWQVSDLRTREALVQAWDEATRWGQTPIAADQALQVALTPIQGWQVFYYRGDAWSNPLSADGLARGQAATAGGLGGAGGAAALARELGAMPDGVRLVLDLAPSTALNGSLVRDWVRPVVGGGKS
jgi:general secretion pathway protein J